MRTLRDALASTDGLWHGDTYVCGIHYADFHLLRSAAEAFLKLVERQEDWVAVIAGES